MVATIWLLGCVLAPAQSPPRPVMPALPVIHRQPAQTTPVSSLRGGNWVLTPRLVRGQELVYRGTFTEESVGARVQFQRTYRFETRYFVLDTPSRGVNLAALTILQARAPGSSNPHIRIEGPAASIRLEKISVDLQGKVSAPGLSLAVPLQGPSSLEVGAFVEVPRGRLAINQGWEVAEPDRPIVAWRLVGTDTANGQNCLKLVGVQQTDDWKRPRADRGAWRRQETVWIQPRTGLAVRVERIIEHHEPARTEVSQRSVLRYELESSLQYPSQLAQDRRQEITQVFSFRDAATGLVAEPAKYNRQLAALQRRIAYHLENHPPTPYREAVLLIKRQVDAACRGEVVTIAHHHTARPPAAPALPAAATVGEPAPDFVVSEFATKGTARLGKWKGKPIVLVFYHPNSITVRDILRFAQELHSTYGSYASVIGLSVSDDSKAVLDQRTQMKLAFPVLFGGGLRSTYGVMTTPKIVVIDAAGIIRGMYLGWGAETASEVTTELRRWLPVR